MALTDAFISVKQITASWRLPRGKPIHYEIDALCYATEAIQFLKLTSYPMPQHTLLTRVAGQNYFRLPKGYTSWIAVGMRYGDIWWPLPIADRLMPYPNSTGQGDMNPAEFGPDLNIDGAHQSWFTAPTVPADFSGTDFAPADFSTMPSGGGTLTAPLSANGWYIGGYGSWSPYDTRWSGVTISKEIGLIVVPENFNVDELYLKYIGIGTVDAMTEIPVVAQHAIEAYMDWKYNCNNRNTSLGVGQDWERKFWAQERLLRSKKDPLGIQDVERSFRRGRYGRSPITNSSLSLNY